MQKTTKDNLCDVGSGIASICCGLGIYGFYAWAKMSGEFMHCRAPQGSLKNVNELILEGATSVKQGAKGLWDQFGA